MADNYHVSLEFKAVAMTAGGRSFSNLYGACHLNDGLCVLCANQLSWMKIRNEKKQLMIMIKNVTGRVRVFLLTR